MQRAATVRGLKSRVLPILTYVAGFYKGSLKGSIRVP